MRRYYSFVAGLDFRNADGIARWLVAASLDLDDVVELRREPDNAHDPQAVSVWAGDEQLGYIPARHAWIAERLDDGRELVATVERIERNPSGTVRFIGLALDTPGLRTDMTLLGCGP